MSDNKKSLGLSYCFLIRLVVHACAFSHQYKIGVVVY